MKSLLKSSNAVFTALSVAAMPVVFTGCSIFASKDASQPQPEWTVARSIRAEASVDILDGSRISGKALIVAKSPSFFRIEVSGPLGTTAAVFIGNDKALSIYANGALNTFRWNDEGVRLPYSFKAEELVTFLLGGKDIAGLQPSSKTIKDSYSITTDEAGGVTSLTKLPAGITVPLPEIFLPRLTAGMSDFRPVANSSFPHLVTIEDGLKKLSIKYKKVEINPVVDDEAFEIPPDK